MLRVSPPDKAYSEAFIRMLDDYAANDPAPGEQFSAGRLDFGAYVAKLRDEERGVGLPDGYVPCSHRWLIDRGEIAGVVRVRHSIAHPLLSQEGGHIGYDIPPSCRRRGNGLAALVVGLDHASELRLTRVLLCAAASNTPSRAIIERCGGRLESEHYSRRLGCAVCRYWIDVPQSPAA